MTNLIDRLKGPFITDFMIADDWLTFFSSWWLIWTFQNQYPFIKYRFNKKMIISDLMAH